MPALVCRKKDSHIVLPSHSDIFYPSISKRCSKMIQTDLRSEGKMERQLFLSDAPVSNGVCSNPVCSVGNVPPEKVPHFQLAFSQLSLRCSLFVRLRAPVSPRDAICRLPTVYFNVNIFFVEKQKGWKKGGYGNIQDEIRNLRQQRTHQLPQLTCSSAS